MRKEGVRRDLTEGVIISPIQGENSVFPLREQVALPVVTTEAGNLASLSHLHFNLNISLSRVNGYSNFVILNRALQKRSTQPKIEWACIHTLRIYNSTHLNTLVMR